MEKPILLIGVMMFCLANGLKIIYKWKQQGLCDIYVRRADFAADIAM